VLQLEAWDFVRRMQWGEEADKEAPDAAVTAAGNEAITEWNHAGDGVE
jgi:hypothetical protein